jgi:hypothetical protein
MEQDVQSFKKSNQLTDIESEAAFIEGSKQIGVGMDIRIW